MNFSQARLHHWLSQQTAVDMFLVTSHANIFWLTGFVGSTGMFLQTKKGEKFLITDSRYEGTAREICRKEEIEFILWDENLREEFGEKIKGTMAIEDSLSLAQVERVKKLFPSSKLQPSSQVLEHLRRQKNPDEIRKIAHAQGHVDSTLLLFMKSNAIEGKSEKELAFKLEQALRAGGKFELSFPVIIAFAENSAIPHHSPTDRKLAHGENILVDCGIKYQGYSSDMTRNFVLGRPSKEFQKKYDVLKEVHAQTLKLFQAGVDGTSIDSFSRRQLGGDAAFFSHSLGHGVGLEIHELPRIATLPKNSKPTPLTILQENEVVTCEPGIYFPGQFGIRIEDLLVVRRNTSQVLSRTTKNLIIL